MQNGPFVINGCRLGAFPVVDADAEIEAAVSAAAAAEVAVVVVGLNADWESEGYDRPTLSLPGRSDELVSRVAAANPNTVVVVQSGSAVTMPWANSVKSVVQAWYGGNEAGHGLADILYGRKNPSARMPLTFPVRKEDVAAFPNFKSARTQVYYDEGIWVGYKHHNVRKIAPQWAFGHGLSYTTFEYAGLEISAPSEKTTAAEWSATVKVTVTNTGDVAGDHAVLFFVSPPAETATSLKHPEVALQAFTKVYDLAPGASTVAEVKLDKCKSSAMAYPVIFADIPRRHLALGRVLVLMARRGRQLEGARRRRREQHAHQRAVRGQGHDAVAGTVDHQKDR